MPIYNYNGVDFSEDEVLAKAEEKGLDIDSYINKFGIKRIEDEPAIEPPGKPKPVVKKDAATAGKPKSMASKLVKPSSVSQDNIFGEDKTRGSFIGQLQQFGKAPAPKPIKKKPKTIEYKYDSRGYLIPKSTEEPTLFDDIVAYVKDLFPGKEKASEGKLTYYDQTPIKDQQVSFANDSKNAMAASGKFEFLKDYSPEERALFVSKMVPKPSYIEKKYDQDTETFYDAIKPEAVAIATQGIDPKKFKTKSELNKAIELNVKNMVSKDPAFKFEQDYALAKAKPLINSKIAEIKKKYSLTTPESVEKANMELKTYAEKTVTNFLINSSGFKELNTTFAKIQDEATTILDKEYGRGKDVFLSGIDVAKKAASALAKTGGISGAIGTVAEKGLTLAEGIGKGAPTIALGVKQSLISTKHGEINTLNKFYNKYKDKADNEKFNLPETWNDLMAEAENIGQTESLFGSNVPKTFGEARERIKTGIESINNDIRKKVKSIADTKEYIGLFNEADLKNGIQLDDILQLVGEQVPNMAITTAGAVTGNPLLIGLGTANMFTQTYGSQYYDTVEQGLSEDLGRKPEQKEIAEAIGQGKYANRAEAAAFSAISAGLEYVSELNVLKNTGKALGMGNNTEKVLGSLFRGEIKNFGKFMVNASKNISSSALGEYLTEGFQKGLDQVSMGLQLQKDATKYINFNDMASDAKAGGIVGAVFPFAGTVATQTGVELRASAIKAASLFESIKPSTFEGGQISNRLQIDNFFKAAKNNIEERFNTGEITSDDKRKEIETLTTIRSAGLKIPSKFSAQSKEDSINLLLEKANIEKEIQDKDKELVAPELKRLDEIKAELRDISLREAISTDVELTQKMAEAIGVKDTTEIPTLKDSKAVYDYIIANVDLEKLGLTEKDVEDYSDKSIGIFMPLKNGKEALIVNQEVAEMEGLVTTGQHEFLHKVIFNAVKGNVALQKGIGVELYNHIEKTLGTEVLAKTEFQERHLEYKKDFDKAKEKVETVIKKAKGYLDRGLIDEKKYNETISGANEYFAKQEGKYWEEVLPLLSEALSRGDITYNESFFTRLGDIIRRLLQKYGFKNISFETGKDVFNFIKDYNKTFEKGGKNKAFERLTKEGKYIGGVSNIAGETTKEDIKESKALISSLNEELQNLEDEYDEGFGDMEEDEYLSRKGNIERKIKAAEKLIEKAPEKIVQPEELTEEDEVKKIIKEEKASLSSDKVQKIYDEKGVNGAQEIIDLFKPITKRIVDKRRDAPGFDRELLMDEVETGTGGILDLITKYNPESGVPLAAYINKYLPVRAIAASKRVLDKDFSTDVTEQKGLMAEEAPQEAKERPKYKNALGSKVFEPEVLESINNKILTVVRTLKSKIDEPVSINRTVTPLIAEIRDEIGKQTDIDIKTAMGGKKDNQLKNWLLKNKRYVLENMTTTWLMGKDGQGGIPQAVQKRIDGQWVNYPEWIGKKIDRESVSTDQAGRTSGAELVRRLPNVYSNVSDEDYLSQILEPSGNPIRGRKESLAKAIAEESAFDIISNDFANEGIIYEAFSTNQERLGVAITDTLLNEFNRQVERGNVKFSKKLTEKTLKELDKNNWDVNSEGFKAFTDTLKKDELKYLEELINLKTIENLMAQLRAIRYTNAGYEFEEEVIKKVNSAVNDVKSRLEGFEVLTKKIAGPNSRAIDFQLSKDNTVYNFECKANKNAQIGSITISNVNADPIINKDLGINNDIKDALKNNKGIKEYFDFLLSEEVGGKLTKYGNIKVNIFKFLEAQTNGLQAKATTKIKTSQDLIKRLNNGKNDAIIFKDSGVFSYGDTKLDSSLPTLKGDVDFSIRVVRGSRDANNNVTIYFRGFPSMSSNWNQESNVNIDKDPISLLNAIAVSNDIKQSKRIKDSQNSVTNSLSAKLSEEPKGISVFDFDDTIGITSSKVLYTMPDGTEGKLNGAEFAKEGARLLEEGAIFDFSEFSKVVDGKPGPMVEKMKKMIGKFGPDNFFILTARPSDSAQPIHQFLQSIGINIPLENITGLGNSTAQAKADWITAKAAEGYNDFYFADDHLPNVNAVKNALDVLDVKSKVQQANIKFSKALSEDFNKIIEENKGMEHYKVFSDIVAKRRGADKNKFDFFVPPGAADFELLLYKFLGKGKRGEEQYKFFSDALLKPYANGSDLMDAARQSIKNDYKKLLDQFPGIRKQLEKLTPDGDFTYDQAIRVAMWKDEGVDIPGLSERDTNKLTALVNNDPELSTFKQGLIATGRQGKGWVEPEVNWDSNTIISDLHNLTEGAGRKKFLAQFIENTEAIFGKWDNGRLVGPNMNKIEAVYGTNVREAIEDVVYRMINGKNRSVGADKETNAWTNWVNNSTGAIMFLNTRSAALQLLGAVNFLNLRDNNPIAAAKAFANQKQYWQDFATIWNSDKMKERRGGLKEDVAAAEIANAAATSKNKVNAVVSYLLKIGYTPTQIADSFAIASGGAPFYRNRIKSYIKDGYNQEEAESMAWGDFTKVSDETQQSGDPRDISKQQASGAGRLLLTFQNTSMQQSRIVKKSFLDLVNRRGDAKTHIAKITYYLAVQNIMFSALQQGLFAVLFDDDDEKDKEKLKKKNQKIADVADGVLDSILRGTGLAGGVVATLKNVALKYYEEADKKQKAEYAKVVLEAANISPPIGSKMRKLYSGLQQSKFDKDLIKARGWDVMQDGRVHLGPMYSITGKVVESTTNFPLDRLVNKVENVSQALNSQNKAWQRVMVGMGWNPYSIGIEATEGDIKIKEEAKAQRKEEGRIKAKETRERKKDSIAALPIAERIRIRREAAIKRREEKRRRRKMG